MRILVERQESRQAVLDITNEITSRDYVLAREILLEVGSFLSNERYWILQMSILLLL